MNKTQNISQIADTGPAISAVQQKRQELVQQLVMPGPTVPANPAAQGAPVQAPVPHGQVINVAVNSAIPNLTFKEWMARGVVAAIGRALGFPFRLLGGAIENVVYSMISIIKMAIIVILIPTLIWLGFMLQQKMSHQSSIEAGASALVQDGKRVANGVSAGMSKEVEKSQPKE